MGQMEWRIRPSGHGGWNAERGTYHPGGESVPGVTGQTMPCFLVYESAHFDTQAQAKRFVKRREGARG